MLFILNQILYKKPSSNADIFIQSVAFIKSCITIINCHRSFNSRRFTNSIWSKLLQNIVYFCTPFIRSSLQFSHAMRLFSIKRAPKLMMASYFENMHVFCGLYGTRVPITDSFMVNMTEKEVHFGKYRLSVSQHCRAAAAYAMLTESKATSLSLWSRRKK